MMLYKLSINHKVNIRCAFITPPPNLSGELHLGHFINLLTLDIRVKTFQFLGHDVIFIPGTDYGGISAERKIKQIYGLSPNIDQIDIYERESMSTIYRQFEEWKINCDYALKYFTKDQNFINLAREAITLLTKNNLIYPGQYLVNWCTKCQTAISDEEIIHISRTTNLSYFELSEGISISTTRPDTFFADEALVAAKELENTLPKTVLHPFLNREIPILYSGRISLNKGTGIMKLSPNVSYEDYLIAEELNFPFKKSNEYFDEYNRCISPMHGEKYFMQNADDIIPQIIETWMPFKVEEITSNIPCCYKCNTPISNRWSDEILLDINLMKEINFNTFIDSSDKKIAQNWSVISRPWCISRNLVYGIPIDYCFENQKWEKCTIHLKCNKIFDTWFTSALCSIYVKKKYELHIDTLITGKDIIHFWINRMLFMEKIFNQQCIKRVFCHGILRDQMGNKISKSLGNYIPVKELIEKVSLNKLRLYFIRNFPLEDKKIDIGELLDNRSKYLDVILHTVEQLNQSIFYVDVDIYHSFMGCSLKPLLFAIIQSILEFNLFKSFTLFQQLLSDIKILKKHSINLSQGISSNNIIRWVEKIFSIFIAGSYDSKDNFQDLILNDAEFDLSFISIKNNKYTSVNESTFTYKIKFITSLILQKKVNFETLYNFLIFLNSCRDDEKYSEISNKLIEELLFTEYNFEYDNFQ